MDKTKDLMMMDHIKPTTTKQQWERRDSDASTSSEDLDTAPQPISRRRSSLIDQFRDFLSRSVDFSFKIDDPFEKEMY